MFSLLNKPVGRRICRGHSTLFTGEVELDRRRTLAALVAAPLVLALGGRAASASARTQGDPAAAVAFIRKAGDELAAIVGGNTSTAEKQQKLGSLIDRDVDVDGTARFCLGRFWRLATLKQQHEYEQLFHSVLVREVVVRLGDYQQEQVHLIVGHPEEDYGNIDVPSTLERTGHPPAHVTWVLRDDGSGFKIVDMLAEGVSMRLTVRSDYDSFLTGHNDSIDALLVALRQQLTS